MNSWAAGAEIAGAKSAAMSVASSSCGLALGEAELAPQLPMSAQEPGIDAGQWPQGGIGVFECEASPASSPW